MSNKNDALATAMLAVSDEADQQSAEGTQIISAMCYEAIALQRTEHELHNDLDSADSSLNQRNMLGLQRNLDGICREKVREEMRRSPAPGPVLGSRLREADGTSQLDSDEISGPILVAFPAGSGSREISREYRRAVGKQLHDDAERRKIEKQFSDLALILAQISL